MHAQDAIMVWALGADRPTLAPSSGRAAVAEPDEPKVVLNAGTSQERTMPSARKPLSGGRAPPSFQSPSEVVLPSKKGPAFDQKGAAPRPKPPATPAKPLGASIKSAWWE